MITSDARLAFWMVDLLEEVDELFVHYVGESTNDSYKPNAQLQKFRDHLDAFRRAFFLPERVDAEEREDLRKHREEVFFAERSAQLEVAARVLEDQGHHEAAVSVRRLVK